VSDPVRQIDPAVLDAARRTLRRHGWGGTTAERIATEAGISRITLHRRGIKREDVLAALADVAVEAYRAAMWPVLVAEGTGAERIEHALEALCDVAEAHLEILVALQAASDAVFHAPADDDAQPVETRTPFTEPLERLLRDGTADGTLRPVEDPHETATVLFNGAGWTYLHLRSGHRWPPERARRATLDLLLNGLLCR
jgi:AcrR family transcriptional regulator